MSLKVWLPLNGNLENKGCGNATITGNLTYVDGGKLGKARSAGTITISKDYMTEEGTMCFWINVGPETITAAGGQVYKTSQKYGRKWDLFLFSTKNSFHSWGCVKDESTNTPNGDFTLGDFFPNNTWVHVAVAHDKKNVYVYRNGELYHTKAWSSNGTFTFNGPVTFAETNEGILYNDLRIYDECLTVKQIKEISKGLTLHYTLNRGLGNPNLLRMGGLVNNNATSTSYDEKTDTYTIVSPVTDSTWGAGVKIGTTNKVVIPYGEYYRISMEVYVPTTHTLVVDYNNYSNDSSVASWNSNDNDLSSARLTGTVSIPGGKWTKVVFGSQNAHASNTSKVAIYEESTFGIKTSADTEPVTWYIRHPKVELGTTTSQWCPNSADALYKEMKYDSLIEKDVSGNGYHGIRTGALESSADSARYTGSTLLNGTATTYIYREKLDWLTAPFTFNCWCNQNERTAQHSTGTTTVQFVMSHGRDCGYAGFSLRLSNGTPGFYLGTDTTGTYYSVSSDAQLPLNSWHMLTGTYDGTIAKLYVDGVLKATKESTSAISWAEATGFTIGKMAYSHTSTTTYFPFNGKISDARVYSTALSAEDIKELYNTAAYVDKDGSLRTYELVESGNESLTDSPLYVYGYATSGTFTRETIDCPESASGTALKITCTAAGNGFYMSSNWSSAKAKMVHGQQYVWSLYCKSDNRTTMKFAVECASAQDRTNFTIGPEYRKLSNVFTYSSEISYSAFTSYPTFAVDDNVYIHSFKVEPYNPNLEIMKTGVYKENDLSEGIENQFTMFKQGTETKEIIEI